MARRPLVMGNWKLNGSKVFTKELIEGLKSELHDVTGCDVAIAPPVMYLGTAEAALSGCGCSCGGKSVIQLGAQNVDINVKGAFTGDISSEMLKDFGAKYIISFIPGICCCPISCCFMVYMVFRIFCSRCL